MPSDPDLLEAFRKQCQGILGPEMALMAWIGQPGVDMDDLIDIFKQETGMK